MAAVKPIDYGRRLRVANELEMQKSHSPTAENERIDWIALLITPSGHSHDGKRKLGAVGRPCIAAQHTRGVGGVVA